MYKSGDTIVAKPSFLLKFGVPVEKRHLTLTKYDGDFAEVRFNDEVILTGNGFINNDFFYMPDSVNYEVSKLIEDKNIEFVSFSGTTIEGKVIQINSTQHL